MLHPFDFMAEGRRPNRPLRNFLRRYEPVQVRRVHLNPVFRMPLSHKIGPTARGSCQTGTIQMRVDRSTDFIVSIGNGYPRPDPRRRPGLLPLVQALAAHHGDTPRATVKALVRDLADGWLWGFGAGGPLVGYVLMMPHAQAQHGVRGADLHHIFVQPNARRQGLAGRLIRAAEADARNRGCSYVVIGAHQGNLGARNTYVAMGYDWNEPTHWRFKKTL